MRILYITNVRIPTEKAHGFQIANNCAGFVKNRIEVVLVGPKRKTPIKEDYFKFYNLEDRFEIIKLPVIDIMGWKILPEKISFYILEISFILSAFLYAFFSTKRDDIIYTRSKELVFPLSFIRKNIFFEANDELLKDNFLSRLIVARSRGIIVVNNFLKKKYREYFGLGEEKILVAPNGVWLKDFQIKENKDVLRERFCLPKDKIILGYVGKFTTCEADKGIELIFEALKEINRLNVSQTFGGVKPRQKSGIHFLRSLGSPNEQVRSDFPRSLENKEVILALVGGTEGEIEEYKERAKKMIGGENIFFIPHISPKLIPYYLKSFDVLLLYLPWTFHYAYCSCPLKLFEYAAAKKPIVVSDLPSVREILDEKSAVLVEPDKPAALTKGILEILRNKELAETISDNGFQKVQNYDWEKRTKNILNFINYKILK